MKEEESRRTTPDEETAEPVAWRVVWSEWLQTQRWQRVERIEYARSQAKAVNQALAKLRHDGRKAVVVECYRQS